jgi:spermidine/putrescine transport system ATP-binding protein
VDASFFGTHVRAHFAPLAAPDMRLIVHLPQDATPQVGAVMDRAASAHVVLEE